MEETLHSFVSQLHWALLALVIISSLLVLGKSADVLVDEAVIFSKQSGIPKVVIGATVVSLGTTLPEAAVSVLAAMQGSPGLALGNAVGSIICDTGLILGLACLLAPLPLNREIVNRQGWIQLGAAVALVAASFPWSNHTAAFSEGGRLSQLTGILFLGALATYLLMSVRWARQSVHDEDVTSQADFDTDVSTPLVLAKLAGAIALVVLSAQVLIPAVSEAATRMQVPESIIAATLVAFGTSLPELVTAVTAARRGHGELAIGNVVGADILNVLFVAGAAAAATPEGLLAGGHFFRVLFPVMLLILITFRIGIVISGKSLERPVGVILLGVYALYLVISYVVPH